MPGFVIILVIVVFVVIWCISTNRRLVVLDENICNAMSQIGVQLESRFDVLALLFDLMKDYSQHESEILIDMIKSGRSIITVKSTPNDVMLQEDIISETLGRIAVIVEQYPDLKKNQTYIKTMDAAKTFENMVRISRLIYNDGVTKLNREIRKFPVKMVAGMMGFRQREYLEECSAVDDMQVKNVRKM